MPGHGDGCRRLSADAARRRLSRLRSAARHRRPGARAARVGARMPPFRLGNLGKYCSWALAAVGIGLAWGRGGMLVMGQGVFFGLGGYAMAMHMKLEAAGPGNVPDFMPLYGDGTMPGWWEPFRSGPFTLFAIVALPARRVVHPRLRHPQAPGEGRVLRHPHPGAGGRLLDVADRDDQADRRVQRPEHLHDVLRPQPLRPGRSRRTCT